MRAIARRCFCPPESLTPRSPITVSRPARQGIDQIGPRSARRAASRYVLFGSVQVAIRDVFANGAARTGTHPAARCRFHAAAMRASCAAISMPSIVIRPASHHKSAATGRDRCFPAPDGPTKATVSPGESQIDVVEHSCGATRTRKSHPHNECRHADRPISIAPGHRRYPAPYRASPYTGGNRRFLSDRFRSRR